ncbi:hypothetical protein [Listeria rocourtiae]|uniref:hypothetical protein n=1 Tax=Listeria rocourtiae TaxID=647910 RepID=UPI003D2F79E2
MKGDNELVSSNFTDVVNLNTPSDYTVTLQIINRACIPTITLQVTVHVVTVTPPLSDKPLFV